MPDVLQQDLPRHLGENKHGSPRGRGRCRGLSGSPAARSRVLGIGAGATEQPVCSTCRGLGGARGSKEGRQLPGPSLQAGARHVSLPRTMCPEARGSEGAEAEAPHAQTHAHTHRADAAPSAALLETHGGAGSYRNLTSVNAEANGLDGVGSGGSEQRKG